jgi:hypothetical protein
MTNLPYIPTEYSVKPGLKKLEDEPHFIIDEWYPYYRNEKMDARHERLEKYYIEKPSRDKTASHQLLMKTITFWMAETLAKQYKKISFRSQKELYVFHNDYSNESVWVDEDLNVVQIIKSPDHGYSKKLGDKYPEPAYKNLFDAICSQIQEDVCIMRNDELVANHVCLPSWWSPEEKMGMSMKEMHANVPGMDKTSYEHIWNTCLHKGPYRRYNWTLTDTPILNQHPSKNIGKNFDRESLFLRVEHQVLQGFPEVCAVLFLIHTYVGEARSLEKEQRKTLATAIDNMTDDELYYKGLTNYKDAVTSCLRK